MPYSIEWLIPQRVVVCRISGVVDMDGAQRMAEIMTEHMSSGIAPIHTIFEVTDLESFPTSASHLNALSRWAYLPQAGWLITINAGRLMGFLAKVITHMAGLKHLSAANMEEALLILRKMDLSLTLDSHT